MVQFAVNSHRIDPYKNFKFRLVWNDEGNFGPIAGISKVSGLKRTTELVSHRDGGDLSTKHHSPGVSTFEPITVERGITPRQRVREMGDQGLFARRATAASRCSISART